MVAITLSTNPSIASTFNSRLILATFFCLKAMPGNDQISSH